jgi:putative membrane protein
MMYGYGYGPTMMDGGLGFVGFLLFAVFGALFVAGVVMVILWAVRGGRPHHPGMLHDMPGVRPPMPGDLDPALKIARERFAKGEISAEQLETIKKTLGY